MGRVIEGIRNRPVPLAPHHQVEGLPGLDRTARAQGGFEGGFERTEGGRRNRLSGSGEERDFRAGESRQGLRHRSIQSVPGEENPLLVLAGGEGGRHRVKDTIPLLPQTGGLFALNTHRDHRVLRKIRSALRRLVGPGQEEARALERKVQDVVTRGGVRLIGPNCVGLVVPSVVSLKWPYR